jgi:hypothetical protein
MPSASLSAADMLVGEMRAGKGAGAAMLALLALVGVAPSPTGRPNGPGDGGRP